MNRVRLGVTRAFDEARSAASKLACRALAPVTALVARSAALLAEDVQLDVAHDEAGIVLTVTWALRDNGRGWPFGVVALLPADPALRLESLHCDSLKTRSPKLLRDMADQPLLLETSENDNCREHTVTLKYRFSPTPRAEPTPSFLLVPQHVHRPQRWAEVSQPRVRTRVDCSDGPAMSPRIIGGVGASLAEDSGEGQLLKRGSLRGL